MALSISLTELPLGAAILRFVLTEGSTDHVAA